MKSIAIVHDHLSCKGGAEQVVISFHKAFPTAPIFTLAYDKEGTFEYFKKCNIQTSWFSYISNKEIWIKRLFFPFGLLASKSIDLSKYEIVLMSTTNCAKYIKVNPKSTVICYAHNPFRLAWYPNEYDSYRMAGPLKKGIFRIVLGILRKVDKSSISKVNLLLTNSNLVKHRLNNIYDNYLKEIQVIPPPVKCGNFKVLEGEKKYFLVVSRLEYYKRIDLVVDAFNVLGYSLIVVGKGSCLDDLRKKASSNIRFLSNLDSKELQEVYSRARALIFPQLEDFGITPLEANASGIPVICYGKGGVLDSQLPINNRSISQATAVFFNNQTKEALIQAIIHFESIENQFDSSFIRSHSEEFDELKFINKIKKAVSSAVHSKLYNHSSLLN